MTQEDKKLLLTDLCGRLPYDLVIGISSEPYMPVNIWKIDKLDCYRNTVSITCLPCCEDKIVSIEDVRPYLFPLSSMTEEQRKEYEDALTYHDYVKGGWTIAKSFDDEYIIPYWFVDFWDRWFY